MDPRVVLHRAEHAERYRAAGYWGSRTIADEFHAVALAYPTALAVASGEGRMTYRELDEASDRVAAGLVRLGIPVGAPVLFQVGNQLDVVVVWYAVLKAGLRPVCTLAPHRGHEIGHISRAVGAVVHIVEAGMKFDLVGFALDHAAGHGTLAHVFSIGTDARVRSVMALGNGIPAAEARAEVERVQATLSAADVAVFQLSGGTTGTPKLIPRFHAEYWYNARAYAGNFGWNTTSRIAHLIPIIHNAGIVCAVHGPHSVGAALVLGTADLGASAPLLAREGVTDILIGHGHFIAAERGLNGLPLQRVILSGAKIPPVLFDAVAGLGAWVGQLFGMAEGFFAVSRLDAPEAARRTMVGTPLSPLDEMRILEPGLETECADGTIGELCCRGPYTLAGYFDAEAHNRGAFTSDGFYRTGDLAMVTVIDGMRHLSIEGRIKDMINRGGEKVSGEELELLLGKHPAIAMAAVVAMPDPRLGEKACAFLVARDAPLGMPEIQAHLEALGVAKFKWPERLEWRSDLPRSHVNKIDKKALRAEAAALVAEEEKR